MGSLLMLVMLQGHPFWVILTSALGTISQSLLSEGHQTNRLARSQVACAPTPALFDARLCQETPADFPT